MHPFTSKHSVARFWPWKFARTTQKNEARTLHPVHCPVWFGTATFKFCMHSCDCSLFIPPENIRKTSTSWKHKTKIFLFSGVEIFLMFPRSRERNKSHDMGYPLSCKPLLSSINLELNRIYSILMLFLKNPPFSLKIWQ